jgi:hypothetical protein
VKLPRMRRLPVELRPVYSSFRSAFELVERASASLAQAVPSTRVAGRPLPDALAEFESALAETSDRMAAWRRPETESVWLPCRSAIATSRQLAERLRTEAPALAGFEGLIGAIAALLEPLEAFDDAARAFDSLRSSAGRASPG